MARVLCVARRRGLPRGNCERRAPISADTALRLGLFFSMDPRYWLNLQTEYDLRTVMRTSHDKMRPTSGCFSLRR